MSTRLRSPGALCEMHALQVAVPLASKGHQMPANLDGRSIKSCPTCHNLDRSKIFYWKGGPSRHRMFKRYYQHSNYHSLRITVNDLKFSASRECSFCVTALEIFRWLSRTKGDGPRAVHQAKVEVCIPFASGYPLVLSYSWLPMAGAPLAREYDLQLAVPQKCNHLPWSALTVGQQIPKDPKSSFFRAASWLNNCLKQHDSKICERTNDGLPSSMPKRLVFIGQHQKHIRLIECGNFKYPYTALSYCWGTTRHTSTTKANYQSHIQGVSWSEIPKTHQDAIDFTRALGYRYIWIDSMCIVQDDRDDWSHEASCMGDIYRNAILTISATNANHVGFGCLTERPGSRSFRNKLKRRSDDPTHVLVQEPNTHANLISSPRPEEEWPVFRRAWTLQERLLATRIVHFAAGELVWECASTSSCECGHMDQTSAATPRMRYHAGKLSNMTANQAAQTWDELALGYQNRSLTRETDRLSALSGLAQKFQACELGNYVAGIWSKYALSMMLWEVKTAASPLPTKTMTGRPSRRDSTSPYVAPSWSWASINGRLVRTDPIEPNNAFEAVVELITCEQASPDPFGAINHARITISSPVADGVISTSARHGHAMLEFSHDIRAFLMLDNEREVAGGGKATTQAAKLKVKCVFLRGLKTGPADRYVEALVLRPLPPSLTSNDDLNTHERIGMAHLTKHSLEFLHLLPLQRETLTIV